MSKKSLSIGRLEFSTPVFLAPMAGYTDLSFRTIVRSLGGLGLAYSEMLNPHSIVPTVTRMARQILMTSGEDTPLAYQIYGHEPEVMADGARWLADRGAIMIDINMGCPQKKIARRGAGAGLLNTPETALAIARKVVEAVGVPVTVKIRLMPAKSHVTTSALVRELELAGVSAITVHARTCAQKFCGKANWEDIRLATEAVEHIPVIGNGDVGSPEEAMAMMKDTGCAAVMIGRAALKDPWIIPACAARLGLADTPQPSREDRIELMLRHLELVCLQYGDEIGPILFRKWIPQYAKPLKIPRPRMVEMLKIRGINMLRQELEKL